MGNFSNHYCRGLDGNFGNNFILVDLYKKWEILIFPLSGSSTSRIARYYENPLL